MDSQLGVCADDVHEQLRLIERGRQAFNPVAKYLKVGGPWMSGSC
jgi:hypothetical protein